MSVSILSADNLAIGYGTPRKACPVAAGISLELRAGELVCLIGANGAGKSTLMRTLAGMQPPLAGAVRLLGDELRRLKPAEIARRVSVVLTDRIDAGAMTAAALVALGRYPHTNWLHRLSPADHDAIADALAAAGATALANRRVDMLSDGERQKVMIARALAQDPAALLLDEPTAYLDLPRRAEIMRVLRDLAHADGRAVLLSTHDLDLALRSADRLWLLSRGALHVGAPEDLVLNGAFTQAFAAERVTFDVDAGAFALTAPPRASIALAGDGAAAAWTRRALERIGYAVDANGAACVEVAPDSDGAGYRWRVTHPDGHAAEYASVYALVNALRVG